MTLHHGLLWQIQKATQDELQMAKTWAEMKHGPENVTGRVFSHTADFQGVEVDRSITPGCWLVELVDRNLTP